MKSISTASRLGLAAAALAGVLALVQPYPHKHAWRGGFHGGGFHVAAPWWWFHGGGFHGGFTAAVFTMGLVTGFTRLLSGLLRYGFYPYCY